MGEIPYYYRAVDWERLIREYPPPPGFFEDLFYQWSREDIERVQEERFLAQVRRAWDVPFYRRLWSQAGIGPSDIQGLADLQKLPIYSVEDYRASIERCPPFGDYQGVYFRDGERDPLRVFTSGGTTGKPRPMIYTSWDWEVYSIMLARVYYLHGVRPGDVVQVPMTYGLHVGGFVGDHTVWRWLGCVPVPTSSGLTTPTRRQVEILRDWGVTATCGFPDYFVHLAAVARQMGLDPARDFKMRVFSLTGDTASVMAAWPGAQAYDFFGANEYGMVAAECHERGGLHFWEDAVIPEIVDVDTTGPLGPGQKGNLVITALYKTGSPVIRFNTRDLTRLMPEERCRCGSRFKRMDHHLGRSDTMVKLRGVNIWPEACGRVVRKDPRVTGEYFCYVHKEGSPPRDELTVMVEYREGADLEALKKSLEGSLKEDLEVRINVELVPPGSLTKTTGYGIDPKMKRFEDRRPKA